MASIWDKLLPTPATPTDPKTSQPTSAPGASGAVGQAAGKVVPHEPTGVLYGLSGAASGMTAAGYNRKGAGGAPLGRQALEQEAATARRDRFNPYAARFRAASRKALGRG